MQDGQKIEINGMGLNSLRSNIIILIATVDCFRNLPSYEINEVARFLKHIFQCDVQKLPTSYLVHPYYFVYPTEYRVLEDYIACVDSVDRSLTLCDDTKQDVEVFCGSRFGEQSEERRVQCHRMLWRGIVDGARPAGRLRQAVLEYNACSGRLRRQLDDTCSSAMRNACSGRQVRAVKCVRATMDSMEPLLSELPNVRVVHLMRDPRGVVLSRMKFHDSTRNRYSDGGNDSMAREAELYCRTVAKDARKRIDLERRYPGKIVSLFYEDFVTDIEGYTEKIYRFLDLEMTNSTTSWAAAASKGKNGKDAVSIANTWQDELTYKDSSSIVRRCEEFFRLSRQVSPLMSSSAGVTADVKRYEQPLNDRLGRQKDAVSSNNVL